MSRKSQVASRKLEAGGAGTNPLESTSKGEGSSEWLKRSG